MEPGKRVLIVDDDKDIRFLVGKALRADGHTVDSTGSPAEGLEKIKNGGADLVILDIRMPEMDGLEFLARTREISRNLPVILYSAYGSYKEDFRTWGADEFVVKSPDLRDLRATVRRYVGGDTEANGENEGQEGDS